MNTVRGLKIFGGQIFKFFAKKTLKIFKYNFHKKIV